MQKKDTMWWIKLVLTIIFGWTGWQRFVAKKYISGIVFLLTGGLFFVGWILDIVATAKNKELSFFNM